MLTNVEKTDYSQFSSITQSCPTLCNPMNCSTPDFPITKSQGLLKLMSIKLVMPSKHLMLYHPLLLLPSVFPSIRVFPVSQLFSSGGQSIGVSDSASVFPMNIQGLFPLGLMDLISLLFKGLSRVFFSTTGRKHQFFSTLSSLWSISHICT